MGLRKSKQLAQELVQDRLSRLGERHLSWHVLRNLCEEIDARTTSGDHDSLRLARLAVRLAGRLVQLRRWCRRPKESFELATSFARLAAALRLANRIHSAERALGIAFDVAPDDLKGDLYRRRAWLRIYTGRRSEAQEDAQTAVDLTSGREHALALGTLGAVLYYRNDFEGAADRLGECLRLLGPEDEHRYCGMLVSYIAALSKGSEAELEEGLKLCSELRTKLKPRHKMLRAKLWWSQGLIQHRLGDLKAAWWSLNLARRCLVNMEAAPEVAAIIADMAQLEAEPQMVRHICSEAEEIIAEPDPLWQPLQALSRAAREMIPEAAAALRQAADPLSSCPVL